MQLSNQKLNMLKAIHSGSKLPEGTLVNSIISSRAGNADTGLILCNAAPAGFEQTVSTLTQIKQPAIKQVFYTIGTGSTADGQPSLAEFVPIKTGEGAFTEESLYYRNFKLGGNFKSGIMGQGNRTRKARTDIAFDSIRLPNFFWSEEMDYSILELEQASRNIGSIINLISERESARKMEWDLGIQDIVMIGDPDINNIDGLLTLSGVTVDTTTLVKPLTAMNSTEINDFAGKVVKAYWANSNFTRYPNTFCIPTADYLGLVKFISDASMGLYTKISFLEQAFQKATQNPNFKITHTAYNDKTFNKNPLGVNRYALYRNDNMTLEMNIPIDYTSTTFGTVNNFDFSNVAYGQFSGVFAKRPREILYLDHAVTI